MAIKPGKPKVKPKTPMKRQLKQWQQEMEARDKAIGGRPESKQSRSRKLLAVPKLKGRLAEPPPTTLDQLRKQVREGVKKLTPAKKKRKGIPEKIPPAKTEIGKQLETAHKESNKYLRQLQMKTRSRMVHPVVIKARKERMKKQAQGKKK